MLQEDCLSTSLHFLPKKQEDFIPAYILPLKDITTVGSSFNRYRTFIFFLGAYSEFRTTCNITLISVSECYFSYADALKTNPPPSPLPKRNNKTNPHLFVVTRDSRINAFEHNKLYPCVSYRSVQGNTFATAEGILCPPKRTSVKNSVANSSISSNYHFWVCGRKTHTRPSSFFPSNAFCSKLFQTWQFLFYILPEMDKNFI